MKDHPEIYFRALEPADAETTYLWRQDPEIAAMVVGPRRYVSLVTEREWVLHVIGEHAKGTQQRWAVCAKETGEMIGLSTLHSIDHLNRACQFAIMIGNKAYWGKGVAVRANLFSFDHAFDQLNMNSVRGDLLESNTASLRLHRKLGFTEEGRLRQAVLRNGKFEDLISIAMLRDEFMKLRTVWAEM